MSEHDNDNTSGPRPEATLRDGRVKASIWRNEAEGGPFRSTTFARTYEDKDGNEEGELVRQVYALEELIALLRTFYPRRV